MLEVTDLWLQGNGSEIKNSKFVLGTYMFRLEADARLEGNHIRAMTYFDVKGTATVEMFANAFHIGSMRTMDAATLVMQENVFEDVYTQISSRKFGARRPHEQPLRGLPLGQGALQVNGSGAVTISDNVFRCATSDRYSALAIKVNTDNPGVIQHNVFEGPYRYGGADDAAAIRFEAGSDIAVEDNVFNEWPVAVLVNGGAGTLTGNTFFNNGVAERHRGRWERRHAVPSELHPEHLGDHQQHDTSERDTELVGGCLRSLPTTTTPMVTAGPSTAGR